MSHTPLKIRRALISVSNKLNILKFAQSLVQKNIQLLASGGTAKTLLSSGIKVTKISQYTNFPEIMNGRIKTLHTKIYAGILARPQIDDSIIKQYKIEPIDMVIVNFYPLNPILSTNKCINKNYNDDANEISTDDIDIGGPSIVRSAAKNYKNVVVIVNSNDYNNIIDELNNNNGTISINTRLKLANKAFQYVATYDTLIANKFKKKIFKCQKQNNKKINICLPDYINFMNINFTKKQNMRYGENPHQSAVFYTETYNIKQDSIAQAQQIQGKKLSFNNILDIDTAWECVKIFTQPTCAIIKHGTPCGVSSSHNILESYSKAYQTDPNSAFGGIIAFNKTLDKITTKKIIETQFIEAIIAPHIDSESLKILTNKKNIRILTYKNWNNIKTKSISNLDCKRVNGGLLIQNSDIDTINKHNIKIVTHRQPNTQEIEDAIFCWKIIKFVKSNAIIYGRNKQTIGIGAGQTSRIYAAKIAKMKAHDEGFNLTDAIMASDAFLPFPDTVEFAASIGIKCIIQPGGGIQDTKVITSANKNNISMIFTHIRHFRH